MVINRNLLLRPYNKININIIYIVNYNIILEILYLKK